MIFGAIVNGMDSLISLSSAIKKNDFSTFAATWTALKEIMLSEISQAEKDNYHKISLIKGKKELGR